MKSKKLHRIIGLILILPMIGWTITGFIFFIKPGYQGAYQQLVVKTYPLEKSFVLGANSDWEEAKLIRTALGYHLLVKQDGKSLHLDPETLTAKTEPSESQVRLLVNDAISELSNKSRYGQIETILGTQVETSAGVEIKLNWLSLRLSQQGKDTRLINSLYKIHYLQWSPSKSLNQALGMIGLLLLLLMTILGLQMIRKSPASENN